MTDKQTIHVFFTGFRQSWREATGIESIWREVRKLSSPTVWILPPQEWDTDTQALAQLIARNAEPTATIIVYAYSWGGGWAFPHFAEQLQELGYTVELAILIDAVYRSRLLPAWLPANPLSLFRSPKIKLPANVKAVMQYRQTGSVPAGHDLQLKDITKLLGVVVLPDSHTNIDEAAVVRNYAIEVAERFSKEGNSNEQ